MEEQKRRNKYGEVRPIIHVDFQGKKIVAVGNQALVGNWKFVADFLRSYLPAVLTPEWFRIELSKPLQDRHPIMQWWDGMHQFLAAQKPNADGVLEFKPNGAVFAFNLLAYDVYILRHHQALQAAVVDRLKLPGNFQGARYELFVAATCVRAGCVLEYEDETDRTRRHVEFRATHPGGVVFSVEAKSRHGQAGKKSRGRVGRLINDALGKPTDIPLVIFVDVNAPAEQGSPFERRWFKAVLRSLDSSGAVKSENDQFNQIVFTNHPFMAENAAQPHAPGPEAISLFGKNPKFPMDSSILTALQDAAEKFGNVPTHFPELNNDFD